MTSSDLADWVVEARAGNCFVIWHRLCGLESDPLAMKALSVLVLWATEHTCPPTGPRADEARQLTWGQVPAGWYVKAPDGEWYLVESTRYQAATGQQMVTMLGKEWARLPAGPVTACPGAPSAVDAVVEAFDYPEVLEDGL